MDKTSLLIMLGIIVLLAISLTVTIILFVKSRKKWLLNSQNQYLKGREEGKTEAVGIINETINRIENDRDKLNQMSEKELLVSTMMALASYGRRMDETNARLDTITDYKAYISEMNKQMKVLSESYDNLQNTVINAEKSLNDSIMSSETELKGVVGSAKHSIESFNQTANIASNNVDTLNSRLSNVGDLQRQIDNINTDLNNSLELLESLHAQSSSILSEMNGMLTSYGQSPITKLEQIKHNVDAVYEWVNDLYIKFENLDDNDIDNLEKIEDIQDKVENLYSKFECVNVSGLDRIDDIYSKADEALDRLGSEYGVEFNSISYKINDIESKLSDIESKISDVIDKLD
jgi:predicted  nucleic acid-binding Zn-ribbon protein